MFAATFDRILAFAKKTPRPALLLTDSSIPFMPFGQAQGMGL
jgi:hypothetical protein